MTPPREGGDCPICDGPLMEQDWTFRDGFLAHDFCLRMLETPITRQATLDLMKRRHHPTEVEA